MDMSDVISIGALGLSVYAIYESKRAKSENKLVEKQERVAAVRLESQSLIADCRAILRGIYLAKGETSGYEKTIQDLQTIKSSALEVYDEATALESHLERADLREIARRLGHIRQERVKAEMIEKRLEDKWTVRVDN